MNQRFWRVLNPFWVYRYKRKIWYWSVMQLSYMRTGMHFPPTVDINGVFYVFKNKDAQILIGDYVVFRNHLKHNPAGILHPTVLRAEVPGAKIIIGDHVGISGAIICCETEIIIGDYCMLGANCAIYDTDFHPLNFLERRQNNQLKVRRMPVHVGDDCWIGANAIILKGITVGSRSVIGANAVVTHDVPSGAIVAGNPARVVGTVN